MSRGCGYGHGSGCGRRHHGGGCDSGAAIDSVARIIAALVGRDSCPSGTVIDTVYYKQPTTSNIEYDIVDNTQFLSYVSSRPLTSASGAVDLAGTNISYQGQLLKAASKFTETFFLTKTLVGGPSGKLQATLTYDYSPDGTTTQVSSNRFLVTAAEGAWKHARFVEIEYNNDTGLRTCRILC
jgi:hypothetical protein